MSAFPDFTAATRQSTGGRSFTAYKRLNVGVADFLANLLRDAGKKKYVVMRA
jgi:hypothetical protein